jgi:hypothetical protein
MSHISGVIVRYFPYFHVCYAFEGCSVITFCGTLLFIISPQSRLIFCLYSVIIFFPSKQHLFLRILIPKAFDLYSGQKFSLEEKNKSCQLVQLVLGRVLLWH